MQSVLSVQFPKAKMEETRVSLLTASVLHQEKGKTLVRLSDGRVLPAQRSRGCLVKPEKQDLVLVVDSGFDGVFIIDVLTGGSHATCLSVNGDLSMEANGGTLSLSGRQVHLGPEEAVSIEAPFLKLYGDEGRLRFRNLSFLSRVLCFSVKRADVVCDRLNMTVRHVFQRLKNIFRRIEGLEETRAGRISVKSEKGVDVRGGKFSLTSEENVKIDGQSIHIG